MEGLATLAAGRGTGRPVPAHATDHRARREPRRPGRPPPRASRPPSKPGPASPWSTAGFTKSDVRAWSRRLGLRTWDKPAAACLASRVPYGTPVTLGTLQSVTRGRVRAPAAARFPPAPGPPLRRHRPHRGPRPTTWPPWSPAATRCPGGARGGLPVRHARPRRLPIRQPERMPCRPGCRSPPATSPRIRRGPTGWVPRGRRDDRRAGQADLPRELVREPVIATMVKEFDVVPNIRRADVGESQWLDHLRAGRRRRRRRARRGLAASARGSGSTCSATWSRAEAPGRPGAPARVDQFSSGVRMVQPAPDTLRGS